MRVHRLLRVAAFCLCIAAFTGKTMAQAVDVYVGGLDNGKATVWKNGTPQYLADNGVINSVVVHNGNVYAVGTEGGIVKVWKNGAELYTLSTVQSQANSVAVSESGVVYVAGCEIVSGQVVGRVWKDGIVESGYTDARELFSIFIDGSDIYASGYTTDRNAAVWKNGALLYTLTSGGGDAYSVFVYDGDVYTTGDDYDVANDIFHFKVWKNNNALYTSEEDTWSKSIYVSEGVIYATGSSYNGSEYIATLWTNGVAAELAGGSIGNSVFVSDGNVYVSGANWNTNEALLWINGTATILGNNGSANSVFVVKGTNGIPEIESAGLKIYPNPTKDELIIDNGQLTIDNVKIYDLLGKIIVNCQLSIVNSIDVSALASGIYFVKLETDKGTVTQKFVKE